MKKGTTGEFIGKAILVHGNKYDYSMVDYRVAAKKVIIICKKHGAFEQTPNSHLNGSGCMRCGIEAMRAHHVKKKDKFIKSAECVHDGKYDYSLVEYINTDTDVIIICPTHGEFNQRPDHHLKGHGCPYCAGVGRLNISIFLERARLVHGNKYDYSEAIYKTISTKIKIICPHHGEFMQTVEKHLAGHNCPKCAESRGEEIIRLFLEDNGITFIKNKRFNGCKHRNKLAFDYFLPEHNLCIEYDGIQHFKPIVYWGGHDKYYDNLTRDQIKTDFCEKNGIGLLRIKYDENINEKLIGLLRKTA